MLEDTFLWKGNITSWLPPKDECSAFLILQSLLLNITEPREELTTVIIKLENNSINESTNSNNNC